MRCFVTRTFNSIFDLNKLEIAHFEDLQIGGAGSGHADAVVGPHHTKLC